MNNYNSENLIQINGQAGQKVIKVGTSFFPVCEITPAINFYKCASVNTSNNTWTGYKVNISGETVTFASIATCQLNFGSYYIPLAGEIYNNNATIRVELFSNYPKISSPFNPNNDIDIPWIITASCSNQSELKPPYNAFLHTGRWISDGVLPTTPVWIKWQNTTRKVLVKKYSFTNGEESGSTDRTPKNWLFQGSNDNLNWTTLDNVVEGFSANTPAEKTKVTRILSSNDTAYFFHRIYITETYSDSICRISSIEAYSFI